MKATQSNNIKKDLMIKALEKSLGVITSACKQVGINRSTHHKWYNEDKEYAKMVDDMKEIAIDFAESSLFRQIEDKVPTSTIFYLKTKGKHRGYIETVHNVNENPFELIANKINE